MRAIALLLITCWSIKSVACGPGYYEDNEYLNLFKQELLSDTSLFLLLYEPYTSTYYSQASGKYDAQRKDPNLQEWTEYLGKFEPGVLDWLVYHASLDTVCALENRQLEKKSLPESIKRLSKKRNAGFLSYLAYAKRCEKEAIIITEWYRREQREVHLANINALLKEGEQLLRATKKRFFKMRYLYQLVRLCHYSQNYEAAFRYFDEATALKLNNYIYYRTMEQVAGAYTTIKPSIASYYFARVFNAIPDRKDVCLASFKINSNEDWEEAMRNCKDENERAAFHMLRAMTWGGSEREEFKSIQAIAPKSIYLDVLMMRMVNQYLRVVPIAYQNVVMYSDREIEAMIEHADELEALCTKFIEENGNDERVQLFQLAKAYLQIITKKFEAAKESLNNQNFSAAYALQKRILDLVLEVRELKTMTGDDEDRLYFEAKALATETDNNDILTFYLDNATRLYFDQGEIAKSFLCQQRADLSRFTLKKKLIESLRRFEEKSGKTKFEQELWQTKKWSSDMSFDIFGTYHLQHDQPDSAVFYFNQISADYSPYYIENGQAFDNSIFSGLLDFPRFTEAFERQSDGAHLQYFENTKAINKFQLAKYMAELKKLANDRSNKEEAVQADILLANVWNNLHPNEYFRYVLYFGYNNHYTSGSTIDNEGLRFFDMYEDKYHGRFKYYYDKNIPYQYLEKAAALTEDKELLAKIKFAAMRTEVNERGGVHDYKNGEFLWLGRSGYAEELINEYSNTAYYKQAIKECSYLRLRAARN